MGVGAHQKKVVSVLAYHNTLDLEPCRTKHLVRQPAADARASGVARFGGS